MADIQLVRVDFRLIHGQIVTKWFGATRSNEILVVDDELSQDEFMASIYEMSAPKGAKVRVLSVADAIRDWQDNRLGDGKLLVLFKNVPQLYAAWKGGFPLPEVQIGGLGSAPGRTVVFGPITLDEEDAVNLREINASGIRVYMHQVPEDPFAELEPVLAKAGL